MTDPGDVAERLQVAIREAADAERPVHVAGSGSKAFLSPAPTGNALSVVAHTGIIDYRPEELVITARAGTSLAELSTVLDERRQMLPFEPPELDNSGTLGGAVASGLSGPGRPWYGALRDAVLGVEMLNGLGERLRFGGQVMKNVAGYDVARLMCGSFGALGLILSVSVRTRPQAGSERTLEFELDRDAALARVVELGRRSLPVTATCHADQRLALRLSGTAAEVEDAARQLGGETGNAALWKAMRDLEEPFFESDLTTQLWRVMTPFAAPFPEIQGRWLTEWGGARRWLRTAERASVVQEQVREVDGHARCFSPSRTGADLEPQLFRYHARVKTAFDPHGILNPGIDWAGR